MSYLLLAGILNFLVAALHIGIIFGGANWYRFFGAGEAFAQMAEAGNSYPARVTAFIALVFCCWGLIAWSGAGIVPKLPWVKWMLAGITLVFLLRGMAGLILPFVSSHPMVLANTLSFWLVSSVICLAVGLVHLMGLRQQWPNL